MKFHACTLKLRGCLNEIASVRPKSCVVVRYDNACGLSGEAGKPFHLFPAGCGIFTAMRVRSSDKHGVPTIFLHKLPESLYSFCVDVSHDA